MKSTSHTDENNEPLTDSNTHKTKHQTRYFSVAAKLNVVNFLIFISGILSIIGAYEIQLGGKMHELNYLHQKYITQLVKSVKDFEVNTDALTSVENNILKVRDQPIACIDLAGPIELFMMDVIGTGNAIQICHDDLAIANNLLKEIDVYKAQKADKQQLINNLNQAIEGFENSGIKFEPLVGKTVTVTFFIVISIVVGKAIVVPIVGLFLSSSVARDYRLLTKTKNNLEKEKQRNARIQSERIASLTTMVAGMAHEVNTPVGASITANSYAVELIIKLQQSYENGQLTEKEFYNFINEMEKINSIVKNNLSRTSDLVRSFKQVSVDQTLDKLTTVNFKGYIEQILTSLTPITKKTGLNFEIHCDNETQGHVYAGALSQIITNLVTNAIHHAFVDTADGSIIISVQEVSNNEIQLSFKDTGCGIPELDRIHIFDPFFTTKRGSGGTGLGLHIVYNLVVDKLQGRITCTSEAGMGTQFDIYFPKNIK